MRSCAWEGGGVYVVIVVGSGFSVFVSFWVERRSLGQEGCANTRIQGFGLWTHEALGAVISGCVVTRC